MPKFDVIDDYEAIARALAARTPRKPARTRGGPRSRLVEALMILLLSRPMRASEIAGILGVESKYVSSYLSYWRSRGYVDYDRGFWYLTPLGEEYAYNLVERLKSSLEDEYARLARSLLLSKKPISSTTNHNNIPLRPADRKHSQSSIAGKTSNFNNESGGTDRVEQVTCVLRLLRGQLSEDEFEVMSSILAHYARWGSTYLYADQLQERLQADQKWLMSKLRSLQTKNLIYIYTDPRLGVRVGLSKALKGTLASCG